MTINNKFNIGDQVYVITDRNQNVGMVTSIMINPKDLVYFVTRDSITERFFDFELSEEENKLFTL